MYAAPVAETAPLAEEVAQRPSRDHGDPDEVLAARCPGCGHTYEVEAGNEHEGFAAGTSWADIPDDWCCPDCGVRDKRDFVPVDRLTAVRGVSAVVPMIGGVTASPQPRTMNERVVAAAAELTCEVGWSGVTMAKLADRVGVSRQTVYNEMGSKPALAEAMVLRELATFLAAVDRAFDRHPDDLVEAIRAAVTDVLVEAERNALLQAVVSSAYGAETDLLPLLTTESDALVHTAHAGRGRPGRDVRRRRRRRSPRRRDRHGRANRPLARDPPLGQPGDTAEGIAWLADRALGATDRPNLSLLAVATARQCQFRRVSGDPTAFTRARPRPGRPGTGRARPARRRCARCVGGLGDEVVEERVEPAA